MKKLVITILAVLWGCVLSAKEKSKLDTIYANEKMNTALFFPKEIRQGIVGNSNFIFTYNREKGQTLGLLKATKGADSNLLVITTDGNIYSYIISYAENLEDLNHFIKATGRIGNEMPNTETGVKAINTVKNESVLNLEKSSNAKIDTTSIEKDCAKLLQLPERKHIVKRKHGLSLGIKNMVYKDDLVYLQMEVKNNSGIDFEIESLEIFKVNGNPKKKSSYQELKMKPVQIYNLPTKVMNGAIRRFIYVLPKFTFSKDEKILIKLVEAKGSQSICLIRKM